MAFQTLRELYLNSIKEYRDRPSFSMYEGEQLTYGDFAERVAQLQELLLDAGINSGDKVALLSGNMPNWGVAYFAATTLGMVIVPILPDFSGPEIDAIILHSEAKALVVSDKLFTKIGKDVIDQMNVVVRIKALAALPATGTFERGKVTEPAPDDVAAIIYTSGTTSQPKGVMLTHGGLSAQVDMVGDIKPIVPDDVFLSILPLSHVYECSLGMLLPFMHGGSAVYMDRPPSASSLLPALAVVRPTAILSVPLIIEKIYKSQVVKRFSANKVVAAIYGFAPTRKMIHRLAGAKLKKSFGGRVTFFGVGGAKLDADTERFLREGKFPYAIGYGLTETAPLIAGANPQLTRYRSTGPAMKGVDIRLENINPATGEGEIVIKSPCTMKGYFKNPEATAAAFTPDGWFRTNDLGAVGRDGYLYIMGRANNMIVGPSGENIYPEEIESVINGHFLVNDSIVKQEKGKLVAMVHFNREELEQKYQNLKEGLGYRMEEIKSELMAYVNSKVSKFSRISVVVEQNTEFEKTPTHKIKRFLYIKK